MVWFCAFRGGRLWEVRVFNPLAFVADLPRREIRAETPRRPSPDVRRAEEPGAKEHRLWNCAGAARRVRPPADWYRARKACRLPRIDEYCGCRRNRKRRTDRPPELARTGVPRASQDPMELAAGLPLRRGLESVTRRWRLRLRGSFRDRNESAEPYVQAKQCRRLLWIRRI